jgi:hypothetical protein
MRAGFPAAMVNGGTDDGTFANRHSGQDARIETNPHIALDVNRRCGHGGGGQSFFTCRDQFHFLASLLCIHRHAVGVH